MTQGVQPCYDYINEGEKHPMALFRLEAKIFSREKRGRSVIAAAAYRAGTRLKDELKEKIHDYRRRSKGVVETTVLTPEGAPDWTRDPGQLWNRVEASEKRVDAQLAREFVLAVPKELPAATQFATAKEWVQRELVDSGMVAEVSLHHTKNGKNPHVHVLCTLRRLDGDRFAAKKAVEWNDVKLLVQQRASWAEAVNAALEAAGRSERVDHRSLKARGLDRDPEPKLGVAATAMKRRGEDSERFQLVRQVKLLNELRPMLNSIRVGGEVAQKGMGANWWERSITFMARVKERTRNLVQNTWQGLVKSRRDQPPQPTEPSR